MARGPNKATPRDRPALTLCSSRARVLHGHPWVYASEVETPLPPGDLDTLPLYDERGRFLGSGIYNPKSQIVWRRYSRGDVSLDREWLARAVQSSIARRSAEAVRRLIWSEADGLPGLIVDQYERTLVVQCLTKAMDARRSEIANILKSILESDELIFRNDAPARTHEGLELEISSDTGRTIEPRWVNIGGLEIHLDLAGGHKTGFYLDQRHEHLEIAKLAAGRRVLDAFTNQGGFALQAKRHGAKEVLAIDSSEPAIEAARRNAERNQLDVRFEVQDVFDYLHAQHKTERFELVVLDPPGFAPKKSALDAALRGYKELNLRAMRMLEVGGVLATYSCSRAVDRATFLEMLTKAASDAGSEWRVLRATGQPPDHPVRLGVPETEYLKGYVLERVA